MKKIILLFSICFFFSSCKEKQVVVSKEKMEVPIEISNSCKSLTDELTVFILSLEENFNPLKIFDEEKENKFNILYDNIFLYKDSASKLVKCDELSKSQKNAVISLMNGLKYEKYLDFLNISYLDYKKGNINEFMMSLMLNNALGNKDHIVKNYKKNKVINILLKIRDNKETSEEFKNNINDILSGDKWEERKKHYKKLSEENKIPMPKGIGIE